MPDRDRCSECAGGLGFQELIEGGGAEGVFDGGEGFIEAAVEGAEVFGVFLEAEGAGLDSSG